MSKHLLSPDELGEKGESRFKELCADAQLICNRSDRDRAGWDFIVDFPYDDQNNLSLDKRLAPLSCHVQVKTIFARTKVVKLKLNMAERLAKELKPSFIAVLKVGDDLKIVEIYLIHMAADRLASVLKRLRTETANKTPLNDLNKKFITFTPTDSERITATGKDLRKSLLTACGDNLSDYAKRKQNELESLGFNGAKFEGKISFKAKNIQEFTDVLLGLREAVPVDNFETFEKRFDIKLQELPSQTAAITIKPKPIDTCSILIRGDDKIPPAIFNADVFALPRLPMIKEHRIHLKSHLFSIDLYQTETGIRPEFRFDIGEKRATSDHWWCYWRALSLFSKNNGIVEITPTKIRSPMSFKIDRIGEWPRANYESYQVSCDKLSNIFKQCGLGQVPEFAWGQIESQFPYIALLDQLVQESLTTFSYDSDVNPAFHALDGRKVIIVNKFLVGDRVVGYYSVADVTVQTELGRTSLTFFNIKLERTTLLSQDPEDFHKFSEDAKEFEGIDILCNLQTSD